MLAITMLYSTHNEKEPATIASPFKFGNKSFDGDLPDEHIISLIPHTLSNCLSTRKGLLSLRNKKKSNKTNNRPLDARGKEYIHRKWTRRMVSLTSDKGFTNSKVVNRLLVTEALQ